MATVPEEIRQTGWRQGDLIEGECVRPLLKASIDFQVYGELYPDILLLVCQDCDLVSTNLVKEPYVEFLAGRFLSVCDNSFRFGRNPRMLHIVVRHRFIEFSIHSRFRIRKEDLCRYGNRTTGFSLGLSEKRQVLGWIAKRYTRPAFPDAFNERLQQKKSKQEKLAQSPISEKVLIVLLDVSNDEYISEQVYTLQIVIGVTEDTPQEMYDEIERNYEAVFSVNGIDVTDIVVRNELDITLRELRTFRRWDRDYRSYPESPHIALPPEGIDVQ